MKRLLPGALALALSLTALPSVSGGSSTTLVVCAPGFPGNTEQAQPTMDAFAVRVVEQVGWPADSLAAVYHQRAEPGIAAIRDGQASLALVPLSFWMRYGEELSLVPQLQAEPTSGGEESWTLVAGKGLVTDAAGLDGWQLVSRAGYAPAFVRDVVLDGWGPLPGTTEVEATARALSALRRASRGEQVAVLLDGEQSAALEALPFADELEVLYRSPELPASLLCTVGDRLDEPRVAPLLAALLTLHEDAAGAEVLEEMRLTGFRPLQPGTLDRLRRTVAP